jgi:tetratricopeptide (TPR) repeat protein
MLRPRFAALPVVAALLMGGLVSGCNDSKPKEATSEQLVQAGLASAAKGDDKAALSAFSEAAGKDPKNFLAQYNLGTIYQKQGDTVLALQHYGLALQVNPNYVPALYNSAVIYGATNPQLAIITYRKIIQLQPKAPTAYLNLGLLEAKLGLFTQAGKDLQKALDQDPSLTSSIPKDVFKNSPTPHPASTPS